MKFFPRAQWDANKKIVSISKYGDSFYPFLGPAFSLPSIVRCATFSQLISHSSNSISREIYHRPPAHGLKEVGWLDPDRGPSTKFVIVFNMGWLLSHYTSWTLRLVSSLSLRLLIRLWIVYSWLRNLLFIHFQELGRPIWPLTTAPEAASQRCKSGWKDGEMGRRENLFITLVSEYFMAIVSFPSYRLHLHVQWIPLVRFCLP